METVKGFLLLFFLFSAPVLSIAGGIMLHETKERKIWFFWALTMAIAIFCLYETDGMNAIFRLAIVPFAVGMFYPFLFYLCCFSFLAMIANSYWNHQWLSKILDEYLWLIFLSTLAAIIMSIKKHPKIAEGKPGENKGLI